MVQKSLLDIQTHSRILFGRPEKFPGRILAILQKSQIFMKI